MLLSRSFMVLCFMFSSMIHFELVFMKGVRLDFFFKSWMFQYLSLRLLFSIVLPMLLCQRSVDCIFVGLFLGSCSVFCQYHSLDYCNFIVLKSGSIQILFFSFMLAILYLFLLCINFRISLSYPQSNLFGI